MDCNKCKSKECCGYRKSSVICPYNGLGADDYFYGISSSSGDL